MDAGHLGPVRNYAVGSLDRFSRLYLRKGPPDHHIRLGKGLVVHHNRQQKDLAAGFRIRLLKGPGLGLVPLGGTVAYRIGTSFRRVGTEV